MEISRVEVSRCVLPKLDPEWRFAGAVSTPTQGWLVAIEVDGSSETGLGYASSKLHTGASADVVLAGLRTLCPRLVGRDPRQLAAIMADLGRVLPGNNYAKAGIDLALHDLVSRLHGVPVNELLGGAVVTEAPIIRIIPIKSPHDMALAAETLMGAGYHHFKLKVEGDPVEDVRRVRDVRNAVGPEASIIIDANQSYTPKAAIRAINAMSELGLDLAEQPCRASDVDGLTLVTRSTDVMIDADESAATVADVFRLAQHRVVDSVSIKVDRLGGLMAAQRAVAICEAGGLAYRVGACVGSQPLAAAGVHLFASLTGLGYPAAELGEFERLSDDPCSGLEVRAGSVLVPAGPGLGVRRDQPQGAGEVVVFDKAA